MEYQSDGAFDRERLQRLGERATAPKHQADWRDQPGHIIDAALLILADGHPWSADAIWTAARRRHMLPRTPKKDVYVALDQYIERHSGPGRWSSIVQDADRRFRLNHPLDDWPDPKEPLPSRRPIANVDTLRRDLLATQRGDDPVAYELAVCRAFEALGFVTRHVGGNGAPDGVLDAPLGPLTYRVMIECKRAKMHWVLDPDAAEAARYREAFGAQFAVLIGPAFKQGVTLRDELMKHDVSCWTTDDLVRCLTDAYDPVEMKPLFAPGFARRRVDDIVWERTHGAPKRVAVVCDFLRESATRIQLPVLGAVDAPHLDVNAALLLVDGALTAMGARVPCTHADIEAAFRHLTDPLVADAVYADAAQTAIVFRKVTNAAR